jgi:hypothetical protein
VNGDLLGLADAREAHYLRKPRLASCSFHVLGSTLASMS